MESRPGNASDMLPISSRNSVPPVGELELAFLLLVAAGERASSDLEHLALEQALGDRRAC